jgi:hypothetical protein
VLTDLLCVEIEASLSLQLARSLSHLPDLEPARRQLNDSMNTWLSLRGVPIEKEDDDPLLKVARLKEEEDEAYFQELVILDRELNLVERREPLPAIGQPDHLRSLSVSEQLEFARMAITDLRTRIEALAELDRKRFGESQNAKLLSSVVARLDSARQSLERPVFKIATVAITSAGKSTLSNALIGHMLAPMSKDRMSAGVLCIRHADRLRLLIESLNEVAKAKDSDCPWETGEWRFADVTFSNTYAIYERIKSHVMCRYHDAKRMQRVPAPKVTIDAPLFPVISRDLFGLPDCVDFELFDLPGLNWAKDRDSLRIIQEYCKQCFCVMVLDYMDATTQRRDILLGNLKRHGDGLKGRVDSILFVLNRYDLRNSADPDTKVRATLEALRRDIQDHLKFKQLPDILPLNSMMWMKLQCAWGTSPAEGHSTSDAGIRAFMLNGDPAKEIDGLDVDCGADLNRLRKIDPEFKKWWALHEDHLADLNEEDLRYLYRTGFRYCGGAAVCERLRLRLSESFGAVVVWPIIRQPLNDDTGRTIHFKE